MKRSSLGLKLPEGMRDLLPDELARLEDFERQALTVCYNWAYQKVLTPGLEYRACVEPDADKDDNLYKLFDKKGRILVLRPEFTTPIARLVANRQKEETFPQRYCYSGDVYRNDSDRFKEFRQLGVELVGSHADLADGEVIALAVEIARTLNFNKFQLRLGHNGIFSGLARELKFDEELRRQLEDEISRKNMVKLERTIEQSSLSADVKELLFSMPHLTGGEEVLDKLQTWGHIEAIAEAAESLRNIFRYLQHFGVKKEVTVDLGILRGFSYYTGVIFEGYLPGIGIPILEGGRYDRLYADFGLNHPATGWAMNLGLISEYQAGPEKEATMILVYGESVEKVIKHCRELRESGHQVEMALEDLTPQEAEQLAKEKGLKHVVRVEKDERKKVCLDKS